MGTQSNSMKSYNNKKETIEVKSPEIPTSVNIDHATKETLEEPSLKLCVDAISGNKMPSNGETIEFIAPNLVEGELEVNIEEDDIESEVKLWDSALIMYVIGKDLSMNVVKEYMIKFWNFVQLPELYYHDEGYFLLKFKVYKDPGVMRGPHTIQNMPMVLKDLTPKFDFKRDMLCMLPIWVKLPSLPLHLWGVRSLGKIGNALGNSLFIDECSANKLRLSYARILVEIDVTQKQK